MFIALSQGLEIGIDIANIGIMGSQSTTHFIILQITYCLAFLVNSIMQPLVFLDEHRLDFF